MKCINLFKALGSFGIIYFSGISTHLVSVGSSSSSIPIVPFPICINHEEKSSISVFSSTLRFGFCNIMSSDNLYILNRRHSIDSVREEAIISVFVPLGFIGRVCRKSPPSSTDLPPKGRFGSSSMSLSVLSSASKHFLSFIGASSQMISSVSLTKVDRCVFFLMW